MELKCWECNKEIEVNIKSEWVEGKSCNNREIINPPNVGWKRFYCEGCKESVEQQLIKDKEEYVRLKIIMTYERAVNSLENQKLDLYEYEEGIKLVKEFALNNPTKFDSSYEMIAAIILINQRINIKMQHKVGKYKADIYLEGIKCIVEIDGERHKESLLEDSNRDIKIREILGGDWEVVRIPTQYLDQNAKVLYKAITELKKEKQKVRAKNGGVIPSHYSKRDRAKSDEVERLVKLQ